MKIYAPPLKDYTLLPNTFIDRYLVSARGEYVKVYLYLLRSSAAGKDWNLSAMADQLEYMEKDLDRAISYWEKQQLLAVKRSSAGDLLEVRFLDIPDAAPSSKAASLSAAAAGQQKEPSKKEAAAGLSVQEPSSRPALDRNTKKLLLDQAEVRQIIFVAEQYYGRPLSSTEQEELLYYYEKLHFSIDLIEYLVEYCLSKGSTSLYYMRKVAHAWAKSGITTVADAKKETNLYNRSYYRILNSFGISKRNPAPAELDMMSHWIDELGFSLDIILEACRRTILQTGQPNFPYANKILEQWKEQNVREMADIVEKDLRHKSSGKEKSSRQTENSSVPGNRFNNFDQRTYDYNDLEKKLLAGAAAK